MTPSDQISTFILYGFPAIISGAMKFIVPTWSLVTSPNSRIRANPRSPILYEPPFLRIFSGLRSLCMTEMLCIAYVNPIAYRDAMNNLLYDRHPIGYAHLLLDHLLQRPTLTILLHQVHSRLSLEVLFQTDHVVALDFLHYGDLGVEEVAGIGTVASTGDEIGFLYYFDGEQLVVFAGFIHTAKVAPTQQLE